MDNNTNISVGGGVLGESGLIALTIPPQWVYNVELVIMVIVFLMGIPGNIVIIIVQAKTANKTSTDWLVFTMAIYELLCSSVNTVLKMFVDINAVWLVVSSEFVCKITPMFYYLAQYGSAQTLGMLAVDRCIKTVFPLSTRCYGNKHAIGVSVAIFIISMTLAFPRSITYTVQKSSSKCAVPLNIKFIGKYLGVAGSLLSLIIFVVMSLSYSLVAISLRKRHLEKLRQRLRRPNAISDSGISSSRGKAVSMAISAISDLQDKQDINRSTKGKGLRRTPRVTDTKNSSSRNGVKTESRVKVHDNAVHPSTCILVAADGPGRSKMLTLEGRNVNRLTVLMFLISLIYVGTNSVLWYLFITNPFALGIPALRLSFSVPMLNCISNPIMFFSMSSRFRQNVKTLFHCR